MSDRPVAPAAVHRLSGPALDVACRAVAALGPHPAIAGPAWWDANAPARRVTHVERAAVALPAPPWPARRALDFCAELAHGLAPVHEAGAAHGALRPEAVGQRPDGGPLAQVPYGDGAAADDMRGLGILLLYLLTGCSERPGLILAGEIGPSVETAALLQSLLAEDPAARPASARQLAARLERIAAGVPDTAPRTLRARSSRRGARLATALVLLGIAGAAGAYVEHHRVGPPGPALSPATVSVPNPPAVSP